MGYICYNKSWVNNFLEKKRVKNFDEDTFILKKGNFEPIISEELWHQCDRIRKSRIREYRLPSGEERKRGMRFPQHLWVKKLCCRCGAGFHRYRWRVLRDGTPVYGYQCMKRTHGPQKAIWKSMKSRDKKSVKPFPSASGSWSWWQNGFLTRFWETRVKQWQKPVKC